MLRSRTFMPKIWNPMDQSFAADIAENLHRADGSRSGATISWGAEDLKCARMRMRVTKKQL